MFRDREYILSELSRAVFESCQLVDNAQCYELLLAAPQGADFQHNKNVYVVHDPLVEEIELMKHSNRSQKEHGLIKVGNQPLFMTEGDFGVNPQNVIRLLKRIYVEREPLLFTHTHWDEGSGPLPSEGDLWNWSIIRNEFPDVACRVVFSYQDKMRSLLFAKALV